MKQRLLPIKLLIIKFCAWVKNLILQIQILMVIPPPTRKVEILRGTWTRCNGPEYRTISDQTIQAGDLGALLNI